MGAAPSDAMPIVLGTALEARCGSGVTGGGRGVRSSTEGRVSAAVSKARSASVRESVWIVILKQDVLNYVHFNKDHVLLDLIEWSIVTKI